jgi:hypothetical protein
VICPIQASDAPNCRDKLGPVLIRSPVLSEQPRRRAEETPSKYIAGDGDRLRDLVATSSELRHCPTFAVPARSWSSNGRGREHEPTLRFALSAIDRLAATCNVR